LIASPSPIGVFDSGVGGLSVLRALLQELPDERFVYVADSGHAPYGERNDDFVLQRSHAITDWLIAHHGIKALVVACNTATAAAISTLRSAYPALPIIGIEPALKPAVQRSTTGLIGVMATRGTLNSEKFRSLLESLHEKATFILQPCDGLAHAIEHEDAIKKEALCADYTGAMGRFGTQPGEIDALVLGCTHYPFAADILRQHIGPDIPLLEGGIPVARQTRRLLAARNALHVGDAVPTAKTDLVLQTTGHAQDLKSAAVRWLGLNTPVDAVEIK
jgi:glutamate racemase